MKNDPKSNYLSRVRDKSSYPAFRAVIGLFSTLLFVLGILIAVAGVIYMLSEKEVGGVLGVIAGIIVFFLAKVWREVSLMIADLADSVIDINSRSDREHANP